MVRGHASVAGGVAPAAFARVRQLNRTDATKLVQSFLLLAFRKNFIYAGSMSTGAEVREAVAQVLKVPPSSLERRMDALRKDGLVPTASQGGGVGSVHFQSDHNVHVWLSLAPLRPGEAAKLVRELDALPFRGSDPQGHKPAGYHLGSALGGSLEELALPFSKGEFLEPQRLEMVKSWTLSICLEPLSAQMTMNNGEEDITYYFVAEDKARGPLSHIIVFSGDLWLTFSTLLADTYIQRNALRAFQFLDATRPAKAGQEQENAGSPKRRCRPVDAR